MNQQPTYCPYLGTKFDRNTKWGYASHLATCYLSEREPFAPSLSHQQRFCLTERYSQCFRLTGQPTVVTPSYDSPGAAPARTAPRGNAADASASFTPLPRQQSAGAPPPSVRVEQPYGQPAQGGAYPGQYPPQQAPQQQPLTPGAVPLGQAPVMGQPHARSSPNPVGQPMAPARPVRSYAGESGGTLQTGPAALLEGVGNLMSGMGRIGLAILGAVVLLIFAVVFLVNVLGSGAPSATTGSGAAGATGTPVSGSLAPVLPSPQPGTDPAGAVPKPISTPTPPVRNVTVSGTGGAGLTLRSEPATTGERLATIPDGTQLQVIEARQTAGGEWFQVRFNNQVGWISAQFAQ